jgi:hypothetical protein
MEGISISEQKVSPIFAPFIDSLFQNKRQKNRKRTEIVIGRALTISR